MTANNIMYHQLMLLGKYTTFPKTREMQKRIKRNKDYHAITKEHNIYVVPC
jgi:hypothetical protein